MQRRKSDFVQVILLQEKIEEISGDYGQGWNLNDNVRQESMGNRSHENVIEVWENEEGVSVIRQA